MLLFDFYFVLLSQLIDILDIGRMVKFRGF